MSGKRARHAPHAPRTPPRAKRRRDHRDRRGRRERERTRRSTGAQVFEEWLRAGLPSLRTYARRNTSRSGRTARRNTSGLKRSGRTTVPPCAVAPDYRRSLAGVPLRRHPGTGPERAVLRPALKGRGGRRKTRKVPPEHAAPFRPSGPRAMTPDRRLCCRPGALSPAPPRATTPGLHSAQSSLRAVAPFRSGRTGRAR